MSAVIGLFKNTHDADLAVKDLQAAGFTNNDLSVMASDAVIRESYPERYDDDIDAAEGAGVGATGGAVVGGLTGLLMGLGALTIPGVGPVITAGTLAAMFGTAAAGAGVGAAAGAVTGGIVAALVDLGVSEDEAHFYAEGVKRGGVLVTVNAVGTTASTARDIMNRHNAMDVDTHRSTWQKEGWSRFDDTTVADSNYPRL